MEKEATIKNKLNEKKDTEYRLKTERINKAKEYLQNFMQEREANLKNNKNLNTTPSSTNINDDTNKEINAWKVIEQTVNSKNNIFGNKHDISRMKESILNKAKSSN